jgi:hypothetical protein
MRHEAILMVCMVVMGGFLALAGLGTVAGLTHGWVTGESHYGLGQFVLYTFFAAGIPAGVAYATFAWRWLTDR